MFQAQYALLVVSWKFPTLSAAVLFQGLRSLIGEKFTIPPFTARLWLNLIPYDRGGQPFQDHLSNLRKEEVITVLN
jgi:hypothetical protein